VTTAPAIPSTLSTSTVRCTHCDLVVPPALVEPGGGPQFCCGGCRAVHEAIRACGLGRYYELRDRAAPTAGAAPGRYETMDDPAFAARHVDAVDDGRRRIDLYLDGIHCAACVWLIERLPQVLAGVVSSRLHFRRRVVTIAWDPTEVRLSAIARCLAGLGYAPHPVTASAVDTARRREERRHLVRIGVAGACAANVMLIAFALYGGMLEGMAAELRTFFRATSLGITLIVLAGPGRVFFVGALSSLRTRVMHMDVPVAIALAAGTAWGAANTVRGTGEVYFESLTAVVFLLLVGRWIQSRQQRSAHDAVELLYCITPATARRIDDDGVARDVAIEALERGAIVEVRSGETVPADGTLLDVGSTFDRAVLTGESRPAEVAAGHPVCAGVVNLGPAVRLRVDATGTETRAGRLMTMIERLSRERAPIVRLADRVAHRFVIVILTIATITLLAWMPAAPEAAIEHAIALLIVTCPCALGLATPLALVAAIGRAARAGILIKGGGTIERLAGRGVILLDKTGTVTEGRSTVAAWRGPSEIGPLVAALERGGAHPVAGALVDAFEAGKHDADVTDVERAARGVSGRVDGRRLVVGAPSFVRAAAASVPDWVEACERDLTARALTPVLVAVDGAIVGAAGIGDRIRADAAEAIAALRRLGWDVGLLSGDHPSVVDVVGRRIGVPETGRVGGATPEDKVAAVRAAAGTGRPVIMVGDGVNDAAAFGAADVGVAVHGSAEASLRAADVFLGHPELATLVALIRGARRSVRVVRRNLAASLLYNVVAGSLAIAGLINPLLAAVLMPISSLTVVTLSYRSRTFEV
jgi:Cu2+-exporting ATPase